MTCFRSGAVVALLVCCAAPLQAQAAAAAAADLVVRRTATDSVVLSAATARDGHRVAFTLGALAADLGGRVVVLADRRDGVPLAPSDGPRRLVIPADGRAARWVRQVRSITRLQSAAHAP